MLFAVAPDVFHRIKLRRVGRQELQLNLAALLGDKLAHQPAAVDGQSIPNDGELDTEVALEVCQELDHLGSFDAADKKTKVEIPHGDSGHGRKALPVEGVLQDWSLATG